MKALLKRGVKTLLFPLKQLFVAAVKEAVAAEVKELEYRVLLKLEQYYANLKQMPSDFKQQLLDDLELRLQRSLANLIKPKFFF